ncbi:MAG: sugar kinase [Planctomycetes bacterium]|nr:sugar kinase [Planctomycetota bacterium]
MALLVLGSVAFDDVRTPAGFRERVLGGSATYFAWAAATLVQTDLIAAVGRDFPDEFMALLRGRGIGLDGLVKMTDADTFHWSGRYGDDLNVAQTNWVKLNVLGKWKPQVPPAWRSHSFVFLANDAPQNQLAALDQMTKPRLVLCDTRDLWIDQDRAGLEQVMRRTDGIVLNDGEARQLTGERNLIRAAHKLHQQGSRIAIIKKGEHGAFLSVEGQGFALPAYPVAEVVDPTGAGDSFAGGLMGFLAHHEATDWKALKLAMLAGTITASYCVEDFSLDRLRTLDVAAFERRMGEFRQFLSL